MSQPAAELRSLLIPVGSGHLILPNSAVAELITYQQAQPVPDAPPWLLGLLAWRTQMIPSVAFEGLAHGERPEVNRRSRLVVLKGTVHKSDIPFYALVTQGFPRLLQLGPSDLAPRDAEEENPIVQMSVTASGVPAEIPNLEAIENLLIARSGSYVA